MIHSTTNNKRQTNNMKWWAILFWLILWQIASIQIGQEILLVSPVSVVQCLGNLLPTKHFWMSIASSLSKIALGFFLALVLGSLLAIVSHVSYIVKELLLPMIQVIKAVPVASFIILCLVWISSRQLSIFISFLMVFPIIYTNTLQGIEQTDIQLLEMAQVFQISWRRKIRYIYLPEVMPYVMSACSVALGMCWKAGIAAEVIGLPTQSIGERLYQAKIYLNTPELFAWTIVIVIVSVLFERIILSVLQQMRKRLER